MADVQRPLRPLLALALRVSSLVTSLIVAACGSGVGAVDASACDKVASRTGSDGAAGTVEQPFKTVQQLADSLRPGQTGCVRAGTYTEQTAGGYVLKFFHGGKTGQRIRIMSYPGERATLKGPVYFPKTSPHVRLSGVDIVGRVRWLHAETVTVQVMARDIVVDGNTITNDRLKSCMIMGSNDGWGTARSVVVRGNEFFRCGDPRHGRLDHSIYVAHSRDSLIADNVFRGTAGYAVHLYPNAQRTQVLRNVMTDNGGGVIFAGEGRMASSGNLVARNIIADTHSDYALSQSWGDRVGRGNLARDNCLWGDGVDGYSDHVNGFAIRGNQVLDPQLVADLGRFRPDSGSPCDALVGRGFAAGAAR